MVVEVTESHLVNQLPQLSAGEQERIGIGLVFLVMFSDEEREQLAEFTSARSKRIERILLEEDLIERLILFGIVTVKDDGATKLGFAFKTSEILLQVSDTAEVTLGLHNKWAELKRAQTEFSHLPLDALKYFATTPQMSEEDIDEDLDLTLLLHQFQLIDEGADLKFCDSPFGALLRATRFVSEFVVECAGGEVPKEKTDAIRAYITDCAQQDALDLPESIGLSQFYKAPHLVRMPLIEHYEMVAGILAQIREHESLEGQIEVIRSTSFATLQEMLRGAALWNFMYAGAFNNYLRGGFTERFATLGEIIDLPPDSFDKNYGIARYDYDPINIVASCASYSDLISIAHLLCEERPEILSALFARQPSVLWTLETGCVWKTTVPKEEREVYQPILNPDKNQRKCATRLAHEYIDAKLASNEPPTETGLFIFLRERTNSSDEIEWRTSAETRALLKMDWDQFLSLHDANLYVRDLSHHKKQISPEEAWKIFMPWHKALGGKDIMAYLCLWRSHNRRSPPLCMLIQHLIHKDNTPEARQERGIEALRLFKRYCKASQQSPTAFTYQKFGAKREEHLSEAKLLEFLGVENWRSILDLLDRLTKRPETKRQRDPSILQQDFLAWMKEHGRKDMFAGYVLWRMDHPKAPYLEDTLPEATPIYEIA